MKVSSKIMAGIVGWMSLLTMMASNAQAEVWCYSGEVIYHDVPCPGVTNAYCALLTCDPGMLSDTTDWNGISPKAFEIVDPNDDGKYFVAWAAIIGKKKIKYNLANAKSPSSSPSGNTNGHIDLIWLMNKPVD
jgi:hypothetical protein